MKTNKIWKVGVSSVLGMLMALLLLVPSASASLLACFIDDLPKLEMTLAESCVILGVQSTGNDLTKVRSLDYGKVEAEFKKDISKEDLENIKSLCEKVYKARIACL